MDDLDDSIDLNKQKSLRGKFVRHKILADADSYLRTAESIDDALIKIITETDRTTFPEEKIDAFVSEFLIRGAHVDTNDEHGNTPLHLAALMGYPESAEELLEYGADVNTVNENGKLPIELALRRGLEIGDDRITQFNRVARIIIKKMEPASIKDIFITTPERSRRIDFQELLFREDMQDTATTVLNTLIEPLSKTRKSFLVNYSLLETNRNGKVSSAISSGEVSTFEAIVRNKIKGVLVHPLVRLFIESRWKSFARSFLIASFLYWILLMGSLTTALVLAALKKDPRIYTKTSHDILRGMCEGISVIFITLALLTEFRTIYIWKSYYVKEYSFFLFSYITVLTALFIYILIPLRAVGSNIQWIFASLAYITLSITAFRYLLNIRKIGKYVLILQNILIHDLMPFLVVSTVMLITFTGGLYFLLHERAKKHIVRVFNSTTQGQPGQRLVTSVDNSISETRSYPLTFLTGIRMIIEGNKIVDYYHSFGWLGIIAHLLFLFFIVVVLRSLLIAQMNHTYSTIQQDATILLILNRARSIIFIQKVIAGVPIIPVKQWFKTEEVWRKPQRMKSTSIEKKIDSKAFAKLEQAIAHLRNTVEELRDYMLFEHRKLNEKLDNFGQH